MSWVRILVAAVVAYVVSVVSLTLLLGNPVVERILYTDEAGQSDKVLAVFFEQEPLPAVTPIWDDVGDAVDRGDGLKVLTVQGLFFVWAVAVALLYAVAWADRPGPWWRRGLIFGVAVWAILFLFFEAFVPFNMLGEPFALVLIELTMQLIAMILTGLAVAFVYRPESIRASSANGTKLDGANLTDAAGRPRR